MQTESDGNPQALSSGDALMGMLLMLDPSTVFSEESLRNFLREQSAWRPHFENLFRTRKTECGDKTDGLGDRLFFFHGLLLVDVGQNFRVRRSIREVFLDQLTQQGVLPAHEDRFKQEAERFTAFVMRTRQQPTSTD